MEEAGSDENSNPDIDLPTVEELITNGKQESVDNSEFGWDIQLSPSQLADSSAVATESPNANIESDVEKDPVNTDKESDEQEEIEDADMPDLDSKPTDISDSEPTDFSKESSVINITEEPISQESEDELPNTKEELANKGQTALHSILYLSQNILQILADIDPSKLAVLQQYKQEFNIQIQKLKLMTSKLSDIEEYKTKEITDANEIDSLIKQRDELRKEVYYKNICLKGVIDRLCTLKFSINSMTTATTILDDQQ